MKITNNLHEKSPVLKVTNFVAYDQAYFYLVINIRK
jgi:hypothetical protein